MAKFSSPPAGPLAAGLERDFCRCRLEVLHLFENFTHVYSAVAGAASYSVHSHHTYCERWSAQREKIARPPRWICPSRGPTSRRDRSGLRSGLGPQHCRVSCHEVRELQPLASPPPPCVPRAAREKGEGGGVMAPAASGLPWPSRADDASRNRREREVMSSAVSGLGKQRSKP